MFGTAFPLAFVMAYLSTIAGLKIDKFKLINNYRRPQPHGAANIGSWGPLLELINSLSILVNISMLTFTSGTTHTIVEKIFGVDDDDESNQYQDDFWMVYGVMLIFFFFVKMATKALVPPIPRNISETIKRQDFIVKNLF